MRARGYAEGAGCGKLGAQVRGFGIMTGEGMAGGGDQDLGEEMIERAEKDEGHQSGSGPDCGGGTGLQGGGAKAAPT